MALDKTGDSWTPVIRNVTSEGFPPGTKNIVTTEKQPRKDYRAILKNYPVWSDLPDYLRGEREEIGLGRKQKEAAEIDRDRPTDNPSTTEKRPDLFRSITAVPEHSNYNVTIESVEVKGYDDIKPIMTRKDAADDKEILELVKKYRRQNWRKSEE